ncbi:hypothetical protein [Inhella proteolytica]|uniref:DUF3108 domain-containing protein n=1 Tax=Inhella proteolytica TaxID=2795029 RepID=A0A931NDU0_9BURK|nr:hypothetical protein [Inhella proteolytica]MBH9576992.1 hypothetical protein [Inhella proteolytica]
MTCITPRGHRRHALQLAALLALPLAQAQAQVPAVPEHALAEASLRAGWSGHELNLQIEAVEGPAAATQPRQGVIVRRYLSAQQWSATGVGGPNHQTSSGSYRLRPAGPQTVIEQSTDASGQLSQLRYQFETTHSGRWLWDLPNGQARLSGRFTRVASNAPADQQLAPVTIAGLHVPLIIKSASSTQLPAGSYPSAGLVLQSYAVDGTLVFQGFGPGNLNSKGTYRYRKVSANTAVEETVQTSDFFTLPYTMVYTFRTPNSGSWYQDFGNGLIRFNGTFDTFPR